jgi:hypothetical protein
MPKRFIAFILLLDDLSEAGNCARPRGWGRISSSDPAGEAMFIALRQRQCQQETTILAERHLSALDDRKSAALQTEINLDAITKAERIMRQIDARWMDYQ